jgi:hypothetical protein
MREMTAMKILLAAILLAGSTGFAMAQSTMSNPSTMGAAAKGMSEAQARYAAEVAGYSNLSELKQDKKGDWMGAGAKGSFMVDPTGKVIPQS